MDQNRRRSTIQHILVSNLLENEAIPEITNLYTSDPINPYHTVDLANMDALSLEKKSFPEITDVKNSYETTPDSQSHTLYETIPALPRVPSNCT